MIEARVNPQESVDAVLARFNASGYARFRRKSFANSSFTIPQRIALSRLERRITKGLKIFSKKYNNQCSETDVSAVILTNAVKVLAKIGTSEALIAVKNAR